MKTQIPLNPPLQKGVGGIFIPGSSQPSGHDLYRESPAVGGRGRATGSPLQKIFIFGGGRFFGYERLALKENP